MPARQTRPDQEQYFQGGYSRDNLPADKTDSTRIDATTEVVAAAPSDPDARPLTPEQLAMRRVSR
jgi:hypothetical protein